MKTATLSLMGATAVFAGTSIYLAVELGKTRDALAAEVERNSARDGRIGQLEANSFRDADAPAPLPEDNEPGVAPPPPVDAPQPTRPFNGRNDTRRPEGNFSEASLRQRRLMQETRLRQTFSDMPRELGLDKATSDKLFDLLADSQDAAATNRRAYADDPIGSRSLADAERRERDAAITALLGPDKASDFLTFEKSIGARMQVGRIDAQMTAADIPLRDDQRTAMIVAIAAEQADHPAPERDPAGNDADYRSRYLEWQAEYSKRVQQKLEPLLTLEQRERYREALELQNARRAEQRARADARRNNQGQP